MTGKIMVVIIKYRRSFAFFIENRLLFHWKNEIVIYT